MEQTYQKPTIEVIEMYYPQMIASSERTVKTEEETTLPPGVGTSDENESEYARAPGFFGGFDE